PPRSTLDRSSAASDVYKRQTLIRAEAPARAVIDVFQPLDPPLMALTAELKRAFDPVGILNPGRMYPGM
ncbi:MAG TPA: 2-hydroxy-acid oxidase, partial [Rhizobiales bacterium]|nr:2-hydroxy-acid oxidase [Hyphomicrobiales bacterium]